MARSSDSFFLLALFKDKTFQAREIRRVIAFATMYLVLTTVLLGIFYNQMLGQLVSGTSPMLFVSEDMRMINEQIPSLSSVLGTWILVMLAVNDYAVASINKQIVSAKASFQQVEQVRGEAANAEQLEASLADCRMALDYFIVADDEDKAA